MQNKSETFINVVFSKLSWSYAPDCTEPAMTSAASTNSAVGDLKNFLMSSKFFVCLLLLKLFTVLLYSNLHKIFDKTYCKC